MMIGGWNGSGKWRQQGPPILRPGEGEKTGCEERSSRSSSGGDAGEKSASDGEWRAGIARGARAPSPRDHEMLRGEGEICGATRDDAGSGDTIKAGGICCTAAVRCEVSFLVGAVALHVLPPPLLPSASRWVLQFRNCTFFYFFYTT